MALGPDGTTTLAAAEGAGEGAEAAAFVRGLEQAIDHAILRHPRGETMVYGIHQELDARMIQLLIERYQRAGWSEVVLREGLTGAHNLILIP